jgi:multiple sugar transport system permease protein
MARDVVAGARWAPRSGRARRGWTRRSTPTLYLFLGPWLLGFLGLTVIPLAYALLVSFTNFDGISLRWHWIGLENYTELIGDPDVWYSMGRTLLFMAITVPLGIAGGLALALLLNRRVRAVGVFRTLFYVPSVVPIVATALLFKIVFDRDAGVVNAVIEWAGGPPVTWLIDPTVFTVMILMVLWGLGGGMVIFLAGLQGVPGELREAAAIDGANAAQTFRAVTLPLLTPVVLFVLVTGVIGSLQTLIQPVLLSAGNTGAFVPRSNFLYMVNVYQQVFQNQRLSYGAAMLWILFVVVLAITLLILRSGALWVYYEVDQDRRG